MKYIFDNCISPRFPLMLSALGVEAVSLRDEFPEDVDDVSFYGSLRGQNVIVVTTDTRQITREQEARALKESGVTAIFFGPFWARMHLWDQAKWLVSKWQRISAFAESVTKGTVAEIKQNGRAQVYPV